MKVQKYNDSHTHISFDDSLTDDIVSFRWFMEAGNVERINFLALNAHTFFEETQLNNSKCLYLKYAFAPVGYAGCCLDYSLGMTRQIAYEQIKRAKEAGFDCWKIIESKPNSQSVWGHRIDDEIYEDAFAYAEKEQFPIIMHVSDPIGEWETSYKTGYLSKKEYQQQALNVLKRHPNLVLTLAHMGFFSDEPDTIEQMFETYPNFYLDIVPAPEEYFVMSKYHERWHEIMNKYSTRILFGTDRGNHPTAGLCKEEWLKRYPQTVDYEKRLFENKGECDGRYPFPGLEEHWGTTWYGLDIDDEAFNNIFYNNFMRIYGEPKEVNFEILYEIAKHEFSLPAKSKYLQEDFQTIKTLCAQKGVKV